MSFQTGLSGLTASSRSLDVIGNNIANANTTGMKSSRTEFGDMVAANLGVAGSGGAGIGVSVAAVSQQFTQGNITTTGNDLDVAVNGGGFFQLTQPDGTFAYTRDGSFKLDKDGYIKTNNGAYVMGYPDSTSAPGTVDKTNGTQILQMRTGAPIEANATSSITAEFNLDARALGPTANTAAGNATIPRSTYGTSLNVFDGEGVATPVSLYFQKTDTPDTWDVFTGLEGVPLTTSTYASIGQITFDSTGKVTGPLATTGTGFSLDLAAATIATSNPNSVPATLAQPITVHLDNVSQFGSAFAVSNLTQDGYAAGELTGLNIGDDGIITARYSNGQTQSAGQLTLSDFRNVQGLEPIGGNAWAATIASGQAINGNVPGDGKYGSLQSGALEDSNVDLTSELVNMMTAQRAYQANAQTIKTQDQIMSTLVNLR